MLSLFTCDEGANLEPVLCGDKEESKVDFIFLLDTSGTLDFHAGALTFERDTYLQEASSLCTSDIRLAFLGISGLSDGLFLEIDVIDYLKNLHGPNVSLAIDRLPETEIRERGANAIEDLSNLYDWRDGACRKILYISDQELDGCCPEKANSNPAELAREGEEVKLAIQAARANDVSVSMQYARNAETVLHPEIIDHYRQLAENTGGTYLETNFSTVLAEFYNARLPEVICDSCFPCKLDDYVK